jgi:hypothetical protein
MGEEEEDHFSRALREATAGREGWHESFALLLRRGGANTAQILADAVDESDYSLVDWVEALLAFDAWLDEKGESRRPFPEMVGYVHCCTMTSSPVLSLPSLKVTLTEALTGFGFDAVSDPHI